MQKKTDESLEGGGFVVVVVAANGNVIAGQKRSPGRIRVLRTAQLRITLFKHT